MRTLQGQGLTRDTSDPTNYPYDRVKDDTAPGANDGTPLVEACGPADLLQAAIELLRKASITPNENPEYKSNSQVNDALDYLYGNSAQPVAVIYAAYESGSDNLVTQTILGNGLNHTWTKGTFASVNSVSMGFKLNITDAGNYIINASNVGAEIKGYNAPPTKYAAVTVNAGHDDTTNYFKNNISNNVTFSIGDPDGTFKGGTNITEAIMKADLGVVLTVYRV